MINSLRPCLDVHRGTLRVLTLRLQRVLQAKGFCKTLRWTVEGKTAGKNSQCDCCLGEKEMPRTDTVAPLGCPPLRALSFDNLGLIKVMESSAENGQPQVVARWGEPNPQKSILGVSLSSDEAFQALAVARRDLTVEILDPCTGAPYTKVNVSTMSANKEHGDISRNSTGNENVAMVGVHLFRAESSGMRSILTCTESGVANLQRLSLEEAEPNCSLDESAAVMWSVCKTGSILCMKVDASEKYAAFGGDGADAALWDLQSQSKIWEAKAPRRDSTGLMSPPFVTTSTFLGNDHCKLVVGTGHHQVRLYDICARRRPMLAFDYLESPIKAVEADLDGYNIFVGTGNGDLASFDMRTGKLLGTFKGRCSGSIRSIARHPTLPIFATCGLDRYLRVFHTSTRQLLTRVFLKQQLVAVVFDSWYPTKTSAARDAAVTDVTAGHNISTKKSKRSRSGEDMHGMHINEKNDEHLHIQATGQLHRKTKIRKDRQGEESRKKKKKVEASSNDVEAGDMHGGEAERLVEEIERAKKAKKALLRGHAKPLRVPQGGKGKKPVMKKKKKKREPVTA